MAPFPDITAHIIDSKLICLFLADRTGSVPAIGVIPSYIFRLIVPAELETQTLLTSAGGILPLSLSRQRVVFTRLLVEFFL